MAAPAPHRMAALLGAWGNRVVFATTPARHLKPSYTVDGRLGNVTLDPFVHGPRAWGGVES